MVLGTLAKTDLFHQEENGEKEPTKNPSNPEKEKSDFPIRVGGSIHLNRTEWQRLNALKELDLQQCEFCDKVNLLNLGWKPFKQVGCQLHEKQHALCPFCLKAARSIIGCELYQLGQENQRVAVKPNRPYDWCACYFCGKELKGASKKGVIKNRNNPEFWGIKCA